MQRSREVERSKLGVHLPRAASLAVLGGLLGQTGGGGLLGQTSGGLPAGERLGHLAVRRLAPGALGGAEGERASSDPPPGRYRTSATIFEGGSLLPGVLPAVGVSSSSLAVGVSSSHQVGVDAPPAARQRVSESDASLVVRSELVGGLVGQSPRVQTRGTGEAGATGAVAVQQDVASRGGEGYTINPKL